MRQAPCALVATSIRFDPPQQGRFYMKILGEGNAKKLTTFFGRRLPNTAPIAK